MNTIKILASVLAFAAIGANAHAQEAEDGQSVPSKPAITQTPTSDLSADPAPQHKPTAGEEAEPATKPVTSQQDAATASAEGASAGVDKQEEVAPTEQS